MPARFQSACALRLLPLLLLLAPFALVPRAAAQNYPRFTHIAAGGAHSLALKADGTVVAWGDNGWGESTVPGGLNGVVALAAGYQHSLALKADGTVVAWGRNFVDQTPVPSGLTGVVAIAAGFDHNLALKSDGTVVAWGSNWAGQITVPVGLRGVVAIAAGNALSLALKSDATVVAWGYADLGQITVPSGLTGVVAIAAEAAHNLALKSDGRVVAWGQIYNGSDRVIETVPDGLGSVVAIAAGYYHSLALKSDGTVEAWGYNGNGETTVPGGLTGVVAIAAGANHNLALKSDGTIVGWGDNSAGQMPQPFIMTQPLSQVSAMGLTANLSVSVSGIPPLSFQWRKDGANVGGATGSVFAIPNVQSKDAGSYSVIITNVSGSVTSSNAVLTVVPILITQQPQDQTSLWSGTTARFSVMVSGAAPLNYQWRKDGTNISGATGSVYPVSITQSSDAGSYSVVITNVYGSVTSSNARVTVVPAPSWPHTPGTVVAWGDDSDGLKTVPDGLNGVVAVAAGDNHNLALRADGTVVAWEGGFQVSTVPGGLNGVVAIAAGGNHSLALKSDGTVVAWGIIGPGGMDSLPAGVPEELDGVVAIAAGRYYSLALKADGTVVAWGADWGGQFTVPAGLNGVVAIAAGYASLALKADGTVVAWGNNSSGQSTVPGGLTGVVAIAAGGAHSLALKADGTVVAWGDNEFGQRTVPGGLTGVVAIAAGGNHSLALIAPPPALLVQASDENVLLSWPLWAQGFALQSSTNLTDENSWTPVLTAPVAEGSQNRVTDPIAGPAKFYRLKK